jgi:hypothetical protein
MMAKLQDILDAGGVCVYAGEMRRELVPLSAYTQQGGSVTGGTVADQLTVATRGTRFLGPGQATGPVGSGSGLRFGKGAR